MADPTQVPRSAGLDWKTLYSFGAPLVGIIATFVAMQNKVGELTKQVDRLDAKVELMTTLTVRVSVLETRLPPVEQRLERIEGLLQRLATQQATNRR